MESVLIRPPRIWEIDFLRGLAVIMMILFHFTYDLRYFFGFENISVQSGFWYYEGRVTATLFMLLLGISTFLMFQRYEWPKFWRRNLKRGLQLFVLGLLITVATWIYAPSMAIHFGMLHFLGISSILLSYFVGKPFQTVIVIIFLLGIGVQMDAIKLEYYALIPLGFPPAEYSSFDYYPLIPLLSVPMLGLLLGQYLYPQSQSLLSRPKLAGYFEILGRQSLVIYLVHQPIILTVGWVVYKFL